MRPLAMDSTSMNPYEQQLYTVFKTFDVDNEEALNKSAVFDLCDALQLEDRGAALIGTLFERSSDRVTFTQFRNGLLSVLSGDSASAAGDAVEPGPAAPPAQSDEDSSGREVAPKFVFGSKKYGRRSRPQRAADSLAPRAASVSRLETGAERASSPRRMRCRRSASAMESRELDSNTDDDGAPDAFDHDRRVDRDRALALCRDLRMDGVDSRLVDRIFQESCADDTITVGEFFDRLNAALTSSIESAREVGPDPEDEGGDPEDDDAGVAGELVVEAWERAGVPRPRRLLLELGFGAAAVRPPDLERALDDELAALAEPLDERRDARTLVLVAALALGRLRLRRARRRAELAAAERDKLRADVAEANARARLLAQDVDESHARMEAELTATLRRAESRHAEAARLAADEAAAERERMAALRARLESELARRNEAEARLRADAEAERARGSQLEARVVAAETRAAAAEREAARLAEAAREVHERAGAGAEGGAESAEAARRALEARLEELRLEAQRLRDRNDELCGALEARASGDLGLGSREERTACGDLSAELRSLMTPEALEECDSAPASIVEGTVAAGVEAGVAAGVQATVEGREVATQTDSADSDLTAIVEELRKDLDDAESRNEIEKQKLADLVRELEASLDAMREEYERCEEYWAGKLAAERAAAEAEQRAGDARLSALAARIADYERHFAPPPLPPIEERAALEAQVADLEREFATHRAEAEAALAARDAELRRLRERAAAAAAAAAAADTRRCRARDCRHAAADANHLPGVPNTPVPGAAAGAWGAWGAGAAREAGAARAAEAARARAARAEAAVRRLHARLHAADLLVKELYVENCHLAHRRAP